MTDFEKRALAALQYVRMAVASGPKRFRREITFALESNADFKLSFNQSVYLITLCHYFRRQIQDEELVKLGAYVKEHKDLPEGIYREEDHRVLPARVPKARVERPKRKTRYELELERGGGRLML